MDIESLALQSSLELIENCGFYVFRFPYNNVCQNVRLFQSITWG